MATAMALMSGGAPYTRKMQVQETFANPGVPALISAGDEGGLALPAVTAASDVIGLTVDTATFTTTQGTGADSAERQVTVILNTDLVWRFRLSGSGTEGTALTQHTNTVADTGGTTITFSAGGTNFDSSVIWGYSGANAGARRQVITVQATDAVVLVPFDHTIAVGDVFLRAPFFEAMTGADMTLSAVFFETDASAAFGGGATDEWRNIGGEYNAIYDDGTLNSFAHFLATDHFLNQLT